MGQWRSVAWPRLIVSAAAILGLVPNLANGQQTLYGGTFSGNYYTNDPKTGKATKIGVLGFECGGMDARCNQLYVWDATNSLLKEINPATGATLATINLGIVSKGDGDIVFRSDGIGFRCDGSAALPAKNFYRFDLTIPSATFIANLAPGFMDGLAFDSADVLYGADAWPLGNLYTIDQNTGATKLVGSLGGPKDNNALRFDASGTLYGTFNFPFPVPGQALYTINTATGATTLVGPLGVGFPEDMNGLAFYPGKPISPGSSGSPGSPGEGSYPGSKGPPLNIPVPSGEGTFGFGGQLLGLRPAARRSPILAGPVSKAAPGGNGNSAVFNVSHRLAPANVQPEQSAYTQKVTILGWILLVGVFFGAVVYLVKMRYLSS